MPEGAEVVGGNNPENTGLRLAGLIRDEWEERHGGEEGGRVAWERTPYKTNLGTRPGPFWWYETTVPDALRGTGEVGDLQDWTLQAKRMRWLLGPVGKRHLRGGERPHVRRRLVELERFVKLAERHGSNDPRTWPSGLQ